MRIYLIGSHAVGKSTLAKYISKKYDLAMIFETARMILSERELHLDTLRSDLDVTDTYQKAVFDRQIAEEQKYKSFVSDRSLIDICAYSAQHSRIISSLLKSKEFQEYISQLKQKDVKIFYVRPSKVTAKNDGVRENIIWDDIIAIDSMVKILLEIYEIDFICLKTDNMQERIQTIDTILKSVI